MRAHATILLCFLSASVCFAADEPEARANASRDAQHLAACTQKLDASCVIRWSDPDAYARVSAPQFHFEEAQTRLFDAMKHDGDRYLSMDIEAPSRVFAGEGRMYAFVPYTAVSQIKGSTTNEKAYFIGISQDAGRNWKFFDAASVPVEKIRLIIPSLGDEPLPPVATW